MFFVFLFFHVVFSPRCNDCQHEQTPMPCATFRSYLWLVSHKENSADHAVIRYIDFFEMMEHKIKKKANL